MSFSAEIRPYRVEIARRAEDDGSGGFGKSGQPRYVSLGEFWTGYTYNKGAKTMRDGVLEAYDVVMFRMAYNDAVDKWCLLRFRGKWYQITSLNSDYREDKMQIIAQEMTNQQVTLVEE